VPHRSFGTVRATEAREPITFDFGVFGEEQFTIIPTPSLGDTFDLYDAPEPTPANELETVRVLARFIRRMLAPEDRHRFDEALKRIPADHGHVVVEAAAWIAEQVTPFPEAPPPSSSGGRRNTGTTSKKKPGGTGRSRR
jgi:hypothetical protein